MGNPVLDWLEVVADIVFAVIVPSLLILTPCDLLLQHRCPCGDSSCRRKLEREERRQQAQRQRVQQDQRDHYELWSTVAEVGVKIRLRQYAQLFGYISEYLAVNLMDGLPSTVCTHVGHFVICLLVLVSGCNIALALEA